MKVLNVFKLRLLMRTGNLLARLSSMRLNGEKYFRKWTVDQVYRVETDGENH